MGGVKTGRRLIRRHLADKGSRNTRLHSISCHRIGIFRVLEMCLHKYITNTILNKCTSVSKETEIRQLTLLRPIFIDYIFGILNAVPRTEIYR